jgi:hypothetical protein
MKIEDQPDRPTEMVQSHPDLPLALLAQGHLFRRPFSPVFVQLHCQQRRQFGPGLPAAKLVHGVMKAQREQVGSEAGSVAVLLRRSIELLERFLRQVLGIFTTPGDPQEGPDQSDAVTQNDGLEGRLVSPAEPPHQVAVALLNLVHLVIAVYLTNELPKRYMQNPGVPKGTPGPT